MRSLILSAFVAGVAAAQTPPPKPEKLDPPPLTSTKSALREITARSPAKGGLDEAIANALKQHPDVKLAEAKRQVAEAELEQAKLLVTQKITIAFAKLEQAKARVQLAEQMYARNSDLFNKGQSSGTERDKAMAELQSAKAEMAVAEAEVKAVRGGTAPTGALLTTTTRLEDFYRATMLSELAEKNYLARDLALTLDRTGSLGHAGASDKLKAVIGRKISLDLQSLSLEEAMAALLKAAGNDAPMVRLPDAAKKALWTKPPLVGPQSGELTFAAWVQLMMDDFAQNQLGLPDNLKGRYEAYVRDYGLLITKSDLAPKDALTLAEYVRRQQAEAAAKSAETKKP